MTASTTAPGSFSLRTDPELLKALEELGVTPDGRNRSKVVREAVIAHAEHQRCEAERIEAEQLAASPTDRAEIAAVQADTEYLRAW